MKRGAILMQSLICLLALVSTTPAQEAPVVRFRAVTPDGAPVANAPVTWTAWTNGLRTEFPGDHERSTTDADGYCTVDFSNHPEVAGNNFEVCVEPEIGRAGIVRVNPTNEKEGPTIIEVVKQVPIRGRVRAEDGTPIAGAVLGSPWFPRTTSDDEGRFTVWGLGTSGSLSVFKEGFAWTEISFAGGELDIVLQPGYRVTLETVDSAGKPIANAEVGYHNMLVKTDAEGRVQTVPFAAGKKISAWASYSQPTTHLSAGAQQLQVEAEPSQIVQLVLTEAVQEPPVTISGRVVMAGTDEPVRARIFVHNAPGEFDYFGRERAVTDEQGNFTLEYRAKAELYILARPTKSTLYGKDGVVRVYCREGSVDGVVLGVAPGTAISGRIKLSDGTEPEPTWVMLQREGSVTQFPAERGHFQFFNLPPQPTAAELIVGDVRMSVTLPAPGEALRDVTLEIPGPSAMAHISGQVVNADGEAQAGLSMTFRFEGSERPAFESVETDGEGRFIIQTAHAGTLSVERITVMRQFTVGGETERRGEDCTILESTEDVEVTPGATIENLRYVIAQPEIATIAGTIRDEAGNLISPRMEFMTANRESVYLQGQVRDGHFRYFKLPEEKFAIEVQLEKHQVRILEEGRDFQRGNENIEVVLPTTPYPEDVPLWTAITGAPWTPEAVDGAIQGKLIRMRFDNYRRLLEPAPQAPITEKTVTPLPSTVNVLVLDPAGKPIPRITIHPAQRYDFDDPNAPVGPLDVLPAPGVAATLLNDTEGRYEVPVGQLLWAEGTCHQYITAPEEGESTPRTIVLHPARRVTVKATFANGSPAPGIKLIPFKNTLSPAYGHRIQSHPVTDANGTAVYETLPPGRYTLLAEASPELFLLNRLVQFDLTGEADLTVAVEVGPYAAGSPDARLADLALAWQNARGADRSATLDPLWEGLSRKERKQLADATRANLKAHVLAEPRSLPLLAEVARLAEMTEALPDLARQVPLLPILNYGDGSLIFEAMAKLGGNDAIPHLLAQLHNSHLQLRDRMAMIAAVNLIGTKESLAAWRKLRDEARALPNAPQAQQEYTHAERMAEAMALAQGAVIGTVHPIPIEHVNATVAEDYRTGSFWTGGTEYKMARQGDEWYPVAIGDTVMW